MKTLVSVSDGLEDFCRMIDCFKDSICKFDGFADLTCNNGFQDSTWEVDGFEEFFCKLRQKIKKQSKMEQKS